MIDQSSRFKNLQKGENTRIAMCNPKPRFIFFSQHFFMLTKILKKFKYVKTITIAEESTSIPILGKRPTLSACVIYIIVGVQSAALAGQDKNHVVVTGDGIDVVALMTLLRKKVGSAELVSVGPMDYRGDRDSMPNIPVGGYYSSNQYGYGRVHGNETTNPKPYDYGRGHGYETTNPNSYDYGRGHGYETTNPNPYNYGPGHGYETWNPNSYDYRPAYVYETRNQNPDSCSMM